MVVVYSTSTSLLVRSLQVSKGGTITGLALDASNRDRVYVTATSGDIERWHWKEGTRTNKWEISSSIHALGTAAHAEEETSNELVYTVDKKDGGKWLLSAHRLVGKGADTNTGVKTLLKYDERLSAFRVLAGGKVIVATSGQQLIVGTTEMPAPDKLSDIVYQWRIVDCPEWVTSFDVRIRPSERTSKRKHGVPLLEAVDVALGGLKGAIHIYEDVLHKLVRKEKAGQAGTSEDISSRRLHWHRNAVLTLKWSLDGKSINES